MFIKVAAKCAYYMYFDKQRGASVPMPVTFARVLAGSVMKTLCDDSDTSDAEVCRIAGAREGGTRKSE